ncbi:hypothetical protein ONE63_007310 [Megalurothrips usitatus]|uniref:DNA endonuclease activator Ctp1 C-terminal domain-containing protein n=1 Tax=Megalurothrips usitatus TaxID=439358 RepID=A0AAV7XVX3_9NEOP|nr:hypothetical protein ONE63_007310 [Megalurothrips usitatus]
MSDALKEKLECQLHFLKCKQESLKALLGSGQDRQLPSSVPKQDMNEECRALMHEIESMLQVEQDMRMALNKKRKKSVTPPASQNMPPYPHVAETVRGNAKKQLDGFPCTQCKEFFKISGLDEKDIKKVCRHKAAYSPVKSPKGYWSVKLPSTPEMLKKQTAPVDYEVLSPPKKRSITRAILKDL